MSFIEPGKIERGEKKKGPAHVWAIRFGKISALSHNSFTV
jgi:hypothetical protein